MEQMNLLLHCQNGFRPLAPFMQSVTYVTTTAPTAMGYIYIGQNGELSLKGYSSFGTATYMANFAFVASA